MSQRVANALRFTAIILAGICALLALGGMMLAVGWIYQQSHLLGVLIGFVDLAALLFIGGLFIDWEDPDL